MIEQNRVYLVTLETDELQPGAFILMRGVQAEGHIAQIDKPGTLLWFARLHDTRPEQFMAGSFVPGSGESQVFHDYVFPAFSTPYRPAVWTFYPVTLQRYADLFRGGDLRSLADYPSDTHLEEALWYDVDPAVDEPLDIPSYLLEQLQRKQ